MRSNVPALIAFAIGSVFALSASAQSPGSEWRPVEIDGVEIAEDAEVFVRFEDGKVNGNGGCNQFFGSYEIDGDKIAFGPLAATKMLCRDPAMANETRLFDALAQTTRFARGPVHLTLFDDADHALVRLTRTDRD